ncbi:L-Ala-D-Glu endopeptidase [Sporosarcina newyorkensis 2681]|uniref:L-Ala-D-Glu endopeptidase n=1 Tax=Sporosarcina newyorkensis 2681 TaxID=1027292 RepID=F9DWT5_9BACL|nr:M23 family metallopeptidase [Sporosarcina newyorkensis]EGQ21539.1 L-Ala-D-Glu endopeptidase [Sporosarcina newyorkensis 2681]
MRHWLLLPIYVITLSLISFAVISAQEQPTQEELLENRMNYYLQFENELVPWYHLAAVDQFERNIQQVRNDIPNKDGIIALQFTNDYWVGTLNPNKEDTSPLSIAFFAGKGLDGNGDDYADPSDDEDVLFTMATFLSGYGSEEEDFSLALWDYYKREETVNQITTIANLYKHFETLDLDEHAFPIPIKHNYSYQGTWGAKRGWGGRRIHEGTDLFASYGVPVQSTSYGVIETLGWNEYGGWRIGIRDIHNTYHYFAHLAYFNKDLKEGDIVEPKTIIGYVGNSGYGKKGTSGKFPPHLHYGMYKDNGRTEWAFDPYPSLRLWERQDRNTDR